MAKIQAKQLSIPSATTSADGLLSAADKLKLDNQGTRFTAPVHWQTTSSITLSGVGTGATAGERVLVLGQSSGSANGIYVIAAGAWARASDADTSAEFTQGMVVPVLYGLYGMPSFFDALAGAQWQLITSSVTLGTTAIDFRLLNKIGSFTAANGLWFDNEYKLSVNLDPSEGSLALDSLGAGYLQVGVLKTDAQHGVRGGGTLHANAIAAGAAGFMSGTDKARFDVTLADPSTNDFRLSPTVDGSVATDGTYSTIYLAPVKGNLISLWSSALGWSHVASAGKTIAITGHTAGLPFDVFAVLSAGVLSISFSDWTSTTVRSVAISKKDGIWTKTSDPTYRYLGTVLPSSATQYVFNTNGSGSASRASCPIWNADNRIQSEFTWSMTTATWTIPSAGTWQTWEGNSNARVDFVTGATSEESASAQVICTVHAKNTDSGIAVGYDSGSTPSGLRGYNAGPTGTVSPGVAHFATRPAIGPHYFAPLARASGIPADFFGTNSLAQSGLVVNLSW